MFLPDQPLVQLLYLFNFLFACVVVFVERRNPAATWAWLMLMAFLPFFGFIIYLILGMKSRKFKIFANKAQSDQELLNMCLGNHFPGLECLTADSHESRAKLLPDHYKRFDDMCYLNFMSGRGSLTENNRVTIYSEGKGKFDDLLKDIASAKYFIHLQYYIVRNDELGRRIIKALSKKAAEGIEVRFFIDGMGCLTTSNKLFAPLLEAGGKLAEFLPPYFVRINYRNHRKLCIIDGHIGYIGGLNIGDEYVGNVPRFGYWRDTHIRVVGDAVKQMQIRFTMDWNFVKHDAPIPFDKRYYPLIETKPGGVRMQIVSSGPDTIWPSIHYGYAKMIFEANKSIYIETPYFVPDDSIFNALRVSALSGVDIRIVIPAHPDHPFVYWASLSYLGELLTAGIRCYKYEKGFIHSKLIVIDSLVSSVGTANMDVRSFDLNFEVNSFIYDRQIARSFEQQFITDLDDCTEITIDSYASRSHAVKIKESVSRLLSPLL